MARSTFKVFFLLKRQNGKNGKVPVAGRITVNGTISRFGCKPPVRTFDGYLQEFGKRVGRAGQSVRLKIAGKP